MRVLIRTTPWLLCAAAVAVTAQAQIAAPEYNTGRTIPGQMVVDQSASLVQSMKQDAGVAALMDHAKAVLIVPGYGANASQLANSAKQQSVEGQTTPTAEAMTRHGSPGVFLVHQSGWSSPAFFSVSNIDMRDMSHQPSNNGVPLVMMFMNSHAADRLQNVSNASLSGLSVAPYNRNATNSDVVVWSPHPVAHGANLTTAQLHFDSTASSSFYMNQASESDILSDNVTSARARQLQNALSTKVASSK
jgi:hypothetical protein